MTAETQSFIRRVTAVIVEKLEELLEWGGVKRDAAFLAVSGAALAASFCGADVLPFDAAWIAIVLCGAPIILEAFIGLVTSSTSRPTCSSRWRLSPR